MCPACIAAALLAAGTVSASGYAAVMKKKKERPKLNIKRRREVTP